MDPVMGRPTGNMGNNPTWQPTLKKSIKKKKNNLRYCSKKKNELNTKKNRMSKTLIALLINKSIKTFPSHYTTCYQAGPVAYAAEHVVLFLTSPNTKLYKRPPLCRGTNARPIVLQFPHRSTRATQKMATPKEGKLFIYIFSKFRICTVKVITRLNLKGP